MSFAFSRDYPAVSKYRRVISSTVISVALLVVFIFLNSWVLYSYPIATVIPSYFLGAERASNLASLVSWDGGHVGEFEHDDKSDVVVSKGPAGRAPSQSTTDTSSTDASDSWSEEQAMERPVSSRNRDGTDHGDKHAASADGLLNSKISPGDTSSESSVDSECDLYHGQWYYDSAGPLYTNNSCPVLTQSQNCQGNGRPDSEYENWRWKPFDCDLPRFNATKFLDLMSGKTVTFVGDSVARNQMESLLCLLWQVEVPENHGSRRMQRWLFKTKSVTIIRVWSAWLVHHTSEPFDYAPEGVAKVHLDVPDENFMQLVPRSDVVILNNGHWFTKSSAYILNNEIVGTQLWSPPEPHNFPINMTNTEAYRVTTETSLSALATHPNYTGLTILMSYSPDHYENGAWNTGGSCTGKVRPLLPGQLVEHEYTNIMHEKQVTGFNQAMKKLRNQSKLKLIDITEPYSYRHDGHPGPYRSPDPNKATKRGPNGRPPPQDCLHWCMPGPVDIWNEFMLETIRREFEGHQNSAL